VTDDIQAAGCNGTPVNARRKGVSFVKAGQASAKVCVPASF